MQFVEDMEKSQRRWYGASVGHVAFDGHLNTGLTLRTVRIHKGVAEVRAGATLLFDSIPDSEEKETELKASACLLAVTSASSGVVPQTLNAPQSSSPWGGIGAGKQVLLIDFEDSFVHTLANYCRQTGATVTTVRHTKAQQALQGMPVVDLVLLSPGPGKPSDFRLSEHIKRALDRKLPIFGVCLGLQGTVEHFGGRLAQLDYPVHGKPSNVKVLAGSGTDGNDPSMFKGLPNTFCVARYHSLYAARPLPECFVETACVAPAEQGNSVMPARLVNGDNGGSPVIMGIQHRTLPVAAVQFHPESILTSPDHGLQLLANALRLCSA
jgi:anthranilate synthase